MIFLESLLDMPSRKDDMSPLAHLVFRKAKLPLPATTNNLEAGTSPDQLQAGKMFLWLGLIPKWWVQNRSEPSDQPLKNCDTGEIWLKVCKVDSMEKLWFETWLVVLEHVLLSIWDNPSHWLICFKIVKKPPTSICLNSFVGSWTQQIQASLRALSNHRLLVMCPTSCGQSAHEKE